MTPSQVAASVLAVSLITGWATWATVAIFGLKLELALVTQLIEQQNAVLEKILIKLG